MLNDKVQRISWNWNDKEVPLDLCLVDWDRKSSPKDGKTVELGPSGRNSLTRHDDSGSWQTNSNAVDLNVIFHI